MATELLRPTDVVKMLNISRATFYRWVKSGKIKVVILPSGRIRVPLEEIKKIVEGGQQDER